MEEFLRDMAFVFGVTVTFIAVEMPTMYYFMHLYGVHK